MEQLPLNIIPKLQYQLGNYVIHSGVSETFRSIQGFFGPEDDNRFYSAFIFGPERSGKTHLSMALTEWLASQGKSAQIISGLDIPAFCYEIDSDNGLTPDALIIDDAHSYLLTAILGGSGQFVTIFEWAKRKGVRVIILSAEKHHSFPCDNHIMSRIKSCAQLEILPPCESDIPMVISSLAKQRGFKLQTRSIEFIRRRLGRDVSSLEKYLDRLMHLAQVLGRSIKSGLINDAL